MNLRTLATWLALPLWVSCSSSIEEPPPQATLQVEPPQLSLAAGTSGSLAATFSLDGAKEVVSQKAAWTTSDERVATVDAAGTVAAVAPGSATVTASHEGLTAAAAVTVTAARLVGLAVEPTTPRLAKGSTLQLDAIGTFSDDSTQPLMAQVEWQSADAGVVTVSSGGLLTGVGVGSTTVTATHAGTGVSAQASIIVTAAEIASVAVEPVNPTVADGLTVQLTATATFTDATHQDVTSSVTWSSTSEGVAAVGANGLVTAVTPGSATVTATASNGKQGSTTITVVPAVVSIAVTPQAPQTPLGVPVQLTATATLSDSSTLDVTADAVWSAAPTGIVQVSNAPAAAGLVTPLAMGTATVGAVLGGIDSASSGGSATVTVTAAELVSIVVTPQDASAAKGTQLNLRAEGHYTDSSTQDLTTLVTWSSDDTAAVTVSNAEGAEGRATAVDVGSATITATEPTSGISGSTTVTVTQAELVSIAITPESPSVRVGMSVALSAEGTYTDDSRQDLTAAVTWSASNGNATISNGSGTEGMLTGVSPGTVGITATDPTSGILDTVTATVTNQVATPRFSPPAGSYSAQQTLTLTSDGAAILWYTDDGSDPSCGSGTQYAGPFVLNRSVTLKAIACEAGRADSAIATASYSITRWLAVSRFGAAVRSTDRGATWTAASTGVSTALYDAAFGGGRWVVVGDGSALRYSDDGGVTWSAGTSSVTSNFRGVAFGGGRWVAVGSDSAVLYSDDGATWTAATGATAGAWSGVTYGNGRFVAVGSGAIHSADGASWSAATGAPASLQGVGTDGAGTFVAVRSSGSTVYRSTNGGAAWSALAITLPASFYYGVAHDAGRWMLTADGRIWHTTDLDAMSWFYISYASTFRDIAVDGASGRVVAGYNNDTGASDIRYSTNTSGSPSFALSGTRGTADALYGLGVGR